MESTIEINRRNYNIWLITIGEPLPLDSDVRLHRTGMLCEQLLKKGHNLIWWTSTFDHNNKKMLYNIDSDVKKSDNFKINLIKGIGYSKNVSLRRLLDHYILSLKLKTRFRNSPKPDIIITSIPCYHISYQAVKYAQKNEIPIITDLRDLWPDIFTMVVRTNILKKLVNLVLAIDFYKLKYCFRKATSLVAISHSYLQLSAKRGNRKITEIDKYFLIGTKPSVVTGTSAKLEPIIKKIKGKKVFAFVGSFGVTYELNILLEAAKYFQQCNKDVVFLLIGTGKQESFLQMESRLLNNVVLTGWLSSYEIMNCLSYAIVGLMPYANFATQSIPNKFFDYLASGLPLISSINNVDMISLLEHYRMGFYYKAGDKDEFILLCKKFIENSALIEEYSVNTKAFFQNYGNSDVIYTNYAEHIEKIIKDFNKYDN